MNICSRGEFGPEFGRIKQWARCLRESASREIHMRFIGKNQNGSAGHTIWIRERKARAQAFFVVASLVVMHEALSSPPTGWPFFLAKEDGARLSRLLRRVLWNLLSIR